MSEQSAVQFTDSILEVTKKLLGLAKEYDSFDTDIIVHINAVFSTLTQMGVGPKEGFTITGYNEVWSDFITSDPLKTQQLRTYMYLKVKSIFDPSANGNIKDALDRSITELETRLYMEEDTADYIKQQQALPPQEDANE